MLAEYCQLLKYYSSVINKHLSAYDRKSSDIFYKQGPTLSYTSVLSRKLKGIQLNLKKKKKKNQFSNGTFYYEKYYILDNKEYLGVHTYKEVKNIWEKNN